MNKLSLRKSILSATNRMMEIIKDLKPNMCERRCYHEQRLDESNTL